MKRMLVLFFAALLVAGSASIASAQLTSAKEGPVVYGHHHLNTTNMDAQKKFFVDTLGGTLIKVGTNNTEIVKFPNVLIFFRATQAPTGGTRGTTVNHIGFSVPNLRPVIDKIKANGFTMITNTESPGREVKDDIAGPLQPGGASIAFAQGPDDVKVEFVEAKQQTIGRLQRFLVKLDRGINDAVVICRVHLQTSIVSRSDDLCPAVSSKVIDNCNT